MSDKQVIFGTPPSKSNAYKIITLPGKKGIPKYSLGKTPSLVRYERDFYLQCNKYRDANIEWHFELIVDVFYPNQRSDLDNSLKIILDCLQKVKAIKNDNRCTKIIINKYLDKINPRIEFLINKI